MDASLRQLNQNHIDRLNRHQERTKIKLNTHNQLLLESKSKLSWKHEDDLLIIYSTFPLSIAGEHVMRILDIGGIKSSVPNPILNNARKEPGHVHLCYTRCKLFYVYFVIVALLILLTLPRLSD